jgi:hypothetical protein
MVKRVFIYGQFATEQSPLPIFLRPEFSSIGSPIAPSGTTELSTEAIEILREFSTLELIGKVYVLTSNRNYQPVTPLGVRNFNWYNDFQKASMNKEKFYFRAKNGDLWTVPWIRLESDDSGAYIAAALKHD